ncbi:MAG: response regulator transcription factor [Pseudomonadales bacterium]|nr:response regulator transcription factor [Pseudomonadales bacterium]MDG1443804.1 response regulator transcription factor [Pseudomonadales bacterium]
MTMLKKKIVVVEDEPDILEVLSYNLKREGFEVTTALDGARGLELVEKNSPDLVVLDLMLPGLDGLEICQRIKNNKKLSHIPVIMVTAKGEESDVVLGLGIGADDYIAKPFSPRELIARVKAVLRRSQVNDVQDDEGIIEIEGLVIDAAKFSVSYEGAPIKFTATEFRLLHQLACSPGRVFSREQLLDHAFGSNVVVVDRNIDVHIRAIRKKISEQKQFIETIRGIGYRFMEVQSE